LELAELVEISAPISASSGRIGTRGQSATSRKGRRCPAPVLLVVVQSGSPRRGAQTMVCWSSA